MVCPFTQVVLSSSTCEFYSRKITYIFIELLQLNFVYKLTKSDEIFFQNFSIILYVAEVTILGKIERLKKKDPEADQTRSV